MTLEMYGVSKNSPPPPLYIPGDVDALPVQKRFAPCGAACYMTAAIVHCYTLQGAGIVYVEWNCSGPPPPSPTS